jgi:hypothetical protein
MLAKAAGLIARTAVVGAEAVMSRRGEAPSSSARLGLAAVRAFSSTPGGDKAPTVAPPRQTIDELARSIDTTLTQEQREYVDSLKKMIRGGPNSPRSLYRDVPRPEEVTGVGNFLPKIADNAQELIDFALSHLPKRAGPRRSRFKQRLVLKRLAKKKQDDLRKEQTIAAKLRKDGKLKKQRALCKQFKEQAKVINNKQSASKPSSVAASL